MARFFSSHRRTHEAPSIIQKPDSESLHILALTTDIWLTHMLDRVASRYGIASDRIADGESTIALAQTHQYDAVIVARERGIDQAALSARLRQENVTCPILIVVHRESVDDVVSGLNAGADAVLVEPISDAEFVARLRATCRRHKMASYAPAPSSQITAHAAASYSSAVTR